MPAQARKELDLHQGDSLEVSYDQQTRSLRLKKPVSIDELSQKASSYIKPGTPALENIDEYYQENRKIT